MKTILRVIVVAVCLAVLSVALSFLGEVNLVWIVGLGLFAAGEENFAVWVALVGGFLLDLLLHSSVGISSLCLGMAFLLGVLVRGIGLLPRWAQSVLIVFAGSFITVFTASVVGALLDEGSAFPRDFTAYFVMRGLGNGFLSLLAFGIIELWKSQNPSERVVKI